jgi:hypothetical protein
MNTTRLWLSLIGFAVTLETFRRLHRAATSYAGASRTAEEALTLLAIGVLLLGIAHHLSFIVGLRGTAVTPESRSRPKRPLPLIVAVSLLAMGIVAISSMAYAISRLG